MIIKCPHCRFKYEDEVAPGIQELSCVCPRCAYPFTVQLTDSPHLSSDDAQASGTNVVQEKGTFVGDMSDNASANVPPMTYPQTPSPSPRPAYPYATNSPRPRNTGCCLKLLIILIIAIGGIVLLGRSCYQSFTADDLEQTEGEYLNVPSLKPQEEELLMEQLLTNTKTALSQLTIVTVTICAKSLQRRAGD